MLTLCQYTSCRSMIHSSERSDGRETRLCDSKTSSVWKKARMIVKTKTLFARAEIELSLRETTLRGRCRRWFVDFELIALQQSRRRSFVGRTASAAGQRLRRRHGTGLRLAWRARPGRTDCYG